MRERPVDGTERLVWRCAAQTASGGGRAAETVRSDVQELLCRAEEACATAARMVSPEVMLLALAR